RWGVLAVVWCVAAFGITLKTAFFHDISEWFGLALYLALGWSGTLSCLVIWRRFGWRFIQPLLGGAIAYTSGAVLDFMRTPVLIPGVLGPHEIFHVAVLAGLGCHWKFVHALVPGTRNGPGSSA
ncbi:MAG TPA: hemolysin III family protein, partial [Planctomycetota bacterium]|nr:hemolysin III family protein [Planctomycetota bacterium]